MLFIIEDSKPAVRAQAKKKKKKKYLHKIRRLEYRVRQKYKTLKNVKNRAVDILLEP